MKTYHPNPQSSNPTRFTKPPRLIEKAASYPEEAIKETFAQTPLDELQEYFLPNWLRVALINTTSPYSSSSDREKLCEFYDQLLLLIEALHSISEDTHLHEEQVSTFFKQFSIEYIRRELADFLEAGIGYEGKYPNGFTPWLGWMAYNNIQCPTEAAYHRYINQQQTCCSAESVHQTQSHFSSQPFIVYDQVRITGIGCNFSNNHY